MRKKVNHVSDVVELQDQDPESPDEEKVSNVSYSACHNSFQSQAWCWRF